MTTVHASAVLVGPRAVLIRGPAGSGKSRLALALIQAGGTALPFTRLIGDDRVHLEATHGRLLVRPAETLAGADPGRAKVSRFAEFPAKGRATGGVRSHTFLKGEASLALAWVGRELGESWNSDPRLKAAFHQAHIVIGVLGAAAIAFYIWHRVNGIKKNRVSQPPA